MKSYYYYLSSISIFGYMFVSTCCVERYTGNKCGETHHDNKTELDHENHEIQEVMNEGPRTTKRALSSHQSGLPDLHHGLPSPS
jgi:hypothetical protein